jgi:hypothetical protein
VPSWAFFSDWSSKTQNTTKNVLHKDLVEKRKVSTNKSGKNPKPIFFDFVLSPFWAFLGEGS